LWVFHLPAVGGGGIPSVKALAIRLNGKGVGGGGRLKFNGRFGKRLAIEFGGGTKMKLKILLFFYQWKVGLFYPSMFHCLQFLIH
jgi:hypothetical protein